MRPEKRIGAIIPSEDHRHFFIFCSHPENCQDRLLRHQLRGENRNVLSSRVKDAAGLWPKSAEKKPSTRIRLSVRFSGEAREALGAGLDDYHAYDERRKKLVRVPARGGQRDAVGVAAHHPFEVPLDAVRRD